MHGLVGPSGAAVAPCTCSARQTHSTSCRDAVVAFGIKRAKQYAPRKELQKQAKQEYLKQMYEAADRIEGDHLIYELKPSSPRIRAQQQQILQYAQLNRQLAEQIPQLQDLQQVQMFLQQHAEVLNYLNVIAVAGKAAELYESFQVHELPSEPDQAALLQQLAALLLQASSWFQPVHFTAAAVAMGRCNVDDPAFWNNLVAASEHKVGAFTFEQLAQVLEILATVGFTPHLQWVERTYRQALKHLHAADAADVCRLMWAWGEMGYTPRDRLFMNQVKIITRRAFTYHELSGQQLVRLMHGIARMPRYAPNAGWLQLLTKEVQSDIHSVTAGDVVDLLLSLTVLNFQPTETWVNAATNRLQEAFGISSSNPAAAEPLLLQLGQQQGPAGIQTAGLLAEEFEQQARGLEQLEELFAEVEAVANTADAVQEYGLQEQQIGQQHQLQDDQQPGTPNQQASMQQPLSNGSGRAAAEPALLTTDQLGIVCWCIGRIDHRPNSRFVQRLALELLQHCPEAPVEVVVDAFQGLVAIDCLPVGQLQQLLLDRTLQLAPTMSPEALVRLCKTLVVLEQGLVQHMQQEAQQDAHVWLQQYQQRHKMQLAAAVVHRQGIILWQSSCQQLADVLSYAAASGIKPSPEYMATAVSRAIAKLQEQGAPAASLCSFIWALASLGFKPHPQQLHQLLAALQRGLHLLGSQELANLGWGLCTLKHRPGTGWLGMYMRQVAAKVGYMEPQALTDTLWALACFAAQPDREWLKQVLQAVLQQVEAGGLTQKNAAVVMWALCQLGFQPQLFVQPSDGSRGAMNDVERAVEGLVQVVQQPQLVGDLAM